MILITADGPAMWLMRRPGFSDIRIFESRSSSTIMDMDIIRLVNVLLRRGLVVHTLRAHQRSSERLDGIWRVVVCPRFLVSP